jgi:hypothetical protein
MRLNDHQVLTDHDLLLSEPNAHHPQTTSFRFSINGQAIGALSAYEHRVFVGEGHQTIRAIIRGKNPIDIQGYDGVWAIGTDGSGQCSANGLRPYGGGGYVTSYVGGYSRLHGDAYLSGWDMFGDPSVVLRDLWIDGDEAVVEFFNRAASPTTVVAYGSAVVK